MIGRPRQLVVVTGTGTEVGKTFVAAATLERLVARGISVAARKPVQSYAPTDTSTDADVLGRASGEPPTRVCPDHRWYPLALAPPMAAEELGQPPFTIADLVAELSWVPGTDVGIVEGAGGPRSPLASDGDTVDLAGALVPDLVLLVADASLGAINAVRLSAPPLQPWPLLVVLNRFDLNDALHHANRAWLTERDGFDVAVDADEVRRRLC